MKKPQLFIILFLVFLLLNVWGNLLSIAMLANVSKVLLMPLLLFHLYFPVSQERNPIFYLIAAALFFSWLGDILLIFQGGGSFFLFGLGAFLIAHLIYAHVYSRARTDQNAGNLLRFQVAMIFVVIIYLTVLLIIIWSGLGSFKMPVVAYALVISIMFITSISRRGRTSSGSFLLVSIGAGLFMISDSLIALNKFWYKIPGASVWIMITYGFAQFMIIRGLIQHMNLVEKKEKLPEDSFPYEI